MKFKNLKYALCSDIVIELYRLDTFNDTLYQGHSLDVSDEFDMYNVVSVLPGDRLLYIQLVLEDENDRNK